LDAKASAWASWCSLYPFVGLGIAVKNWGGDNDLRVPALLWLLTFGWYWHNTNKLGEQVLQGIDPATMAALERGEELTPEQQAQLETNMGTILGIEPGDLPQGMEVNPITFNQAAIKVNTIERQRGTVSLPEAKARLEVPIHFRFLNGAAVREALAESGGAFDPGFLGWVIHESVDMSKPEQWEWAIEVIALTDGHIKAEGLDAGSEAALTKRAKAAAARIGEMDAEGNFHNGFNGYRAAPTLDTQRSTATWVSDLQYADNTNALKCEAIRLGRSAQVLYRLRGVEDNDHELCLRQVRLLANRTAFQADQDYATVGMLDRKASFGLAARATDEDLVELVESQ
jgi:Protein of unknown function (DUF2167)